MQEYSDNYDADAPPPRNRFMNNIYPQNMEHKTKENFNRKNTNFIGN